MKEHDFAGALNAVEELEMLNDAGLYDAAFEEADRLISPHTDTIRHALTLAKKMQDEGNVVVPRELKDAWDGMSNGVDWNNGTHAKIYRPLIQAAQEGNDER